MATSEIVAYYRVSTHMQGFDGLGMDAQRRSVAAYAAANQLVLLAGYEEVETGRKNDLRNRPQLVRALAHARRCSAVLVIARIDRLARSVFITSQLLNSGVDFVACDNPTANRLTIQLLAVMAENESRCISERVRAAIAAKRARGESLSRPGWKPNPEWTRLAAIASAAARVRTTKEAYADLVPLILSLRKKRETLKSIADTLNTMGHRTQRNTHWQGQAVGRLLVREGYQNTRGPRARKNPANRRGPNLGPEAALLLRRERIRKAYAEVSPVAAELWVEGLTFQAIAERLNSLGHLNAWRRRFVSDCVSRLLERDGVISHSRPHHILDGHDVRKATTRRSEAAVETARRFTAPIVPFVLRLWQSGERPEMIASRLNSVGYSTRRGNPWRGRSIARIIARETGLTPGSCPDY